MQTFRFILNRLSSFALTLFAASLIVFATLDLLPGNAAAILLGTAAKPDTIAALERQLGLDQPAYIRYLTWIGGAFTGDLGNSASYGVPVAPLIAERLQVTLPLALMAMPIAVAIGVSLGVAAAAHPRRAPDRAASAFALIGISVPDFWFGILFILSFLVDSALVLGRRLSRLERSSGRPQIAFAPGGRAGVAPGGRSHPRHPLGRTRRDR